MDIISTLNFQTAKLHQILKSDLDRNEVNYNYLISEKGIKFLDKADLQSYLTKTEVKNLAFINQIYQNLNRICDLIDRAIDHKNYRQIENGFFAKKNNGSGFINTPLDFHAIEIRKEHWLILDEIDEKKAFYENENPFSISIVQIANRCSLFINWLTAAYPQLQKSGKEKKIPAKYYALLHWFLIEIGDKSDFERNEDDKYIKSEIEKYAAKNYPDISSQMFYRKYITIDITNKKMIQNSFGKNYKDKLLEISNNNTKLKEFFKSSTY